MSAVLQQRSLLTTLTFTLSRDGVDVIEKSSTVRKNYRVPYASIPSRFTSLTLGSRLWFWIGVLLTLISILTGVATLFRTDVGRFAWLVWAVLALCACAAYLLHRRTFRIFQGGNPPLVLFDGLPNQAAFDAFLVEMNSLRLQWLANRTAVEFGSHPEKLREYILYLRDTGFLSDEEANEIATLHRHRSNLDPSQNQHLN